MHHWIQSHAKIKAEISPPTVAVLPPLLPWWQRRVDCMLWYALSRNCECVGALLQFCTQLDSVSLPHLAEVSSSRSGKSKVIEAISLCLFYLGMVTEKSFIGIILFRVRIGGPFSGHMNISKKKKSLNIPTSANMTYLNTKYGSTSSEWVDSRAKSSWRDPWV